ncbi:MAG: hypothetical protein AAF654_14965 [Myxococcota bacterium]
MSTQPNFIETILDTNGNPVPGARISYFEAGTTTPLATFSDSSLDTPNTNPIVTDGNGRYGPVYWQSDKSYKVRVADASDVILYEVDNLSPLARAGQSSGETSSSALAATPLEFGAAADGLVDDAAPLQSALDAGRSVVDLLGRTYRCDAQLNIPSGVTLRNGRLRYTQAGAITCLAMQGESRSTDDVAITGISGRVVTANLSAVVVQDGDLVILKNSGESAEVEPVVVRASSASDLTTERSVEFTGCDAIDRIVNPVTGAALRDVTVELGPNPTRVLQIDGATGARVDGLSVEGAGSANPMTVVEVSDSYDVDLQNVSARDDDSTSNGTELLRIGSSRYLRATRCDSYSGGDSDDFLARSSGARCIDATLTDCTGGEALSVDGVRLAMRGVSVAGPVTLDGTRPLLHDCNGGLLTVNAEDFAVNAGQFERVQVPGLSAAGTIRDCLVDNPADSVAVEFPGGSTIGTIAFRPSVRMSGCRVKTQAAAALAVEQRFARLVLSGNTFERSDNAGPCIDLNQTGESYVQLIGNQTINGSFGVAATSSPTVQAVGNDFSASASASSGLDIDSANR